jgi:hypothetical protein
VSAGNVLSQIWVTHKIFYRFEVYYGSADSESMESMCFGGTSVWQATTNSCHSPHMVVSRPLRGLKALSFPAIPPFA